MKRRVRKGTLGEQKDFVDGVGKKLGFKDLEDWYGLSTGTFVKMGGKSVLRRHKDSLSCLLENMYPDHEWNPTRFWRIPKKYWFSEENQRDFMDNLGKKLGFEEM